MKNLYYQCLDAKLEMDHHESDLYLKDCPAAREFLRQHEQRFTEFTCQRDNTTWLDVPFAYKPFWESKRPLI